MIEFYAAFCTHFPMTSENLHKNPSTLLAISEKIAYNDLS